MVPRTYPRALAERAARNLLQSEAVAASDLQRLVQTLEAAFTEELFLEESLREEADRVLGLELGADDYIVKPFSSRELLARVRAQVRRARGRSGPSAERSERDQFEERSERSERVTREP